ncbi:ABC transporter permease subunit [Oceanobacillus sp. 143]|nr:ABC transporter permease subunit [Oceanobacillus sp. 143]
MFIPLIYGIIISFTDYNLLSSEATFNGFENYARIFDPNSALNSIFFDGLWNTLQFVLYTVPFLVVIGLALALLLNYLPKKITGLYRTIFFIPYAISVSVVSIIFLWMLDTNAGLINNFLMNLGFDSIPWLTKQPFAWVSLAGATVWWTIGFNMIIFINALNEVPEELYEAASIDGAGAWKQLISITLPSIRPAMLFTILMSTIQSFNVYGQPLLMTEGGPGDSTEVLLMGIVNQAFSQREIGTASAMAVLMALIMIIISAVQFKISNKKEKGEA